MELSFMGWFILAILTLELPYSSWAYPTPVDYDGSVLRWNLRSDEPRAIRFETKAERPSDLNIFQETIADAAQLWSDVKTSYFRYEPAEDGQVADVTINLKPKISGGPYAAGYAVFDDFDDQQKPAVPKHCSIFVATPDDQGYFPIAKTILHELGHCLGLGHTLIPDAIMSYSLDKNSYALDLDDEAAISRLYPQDGTPPKLAAGCAISSASTRHIKFFFWLFPLALIEVTQRVHRRIKYLNARRTS